MQERIGFFIDICKKDDSNGALEVFNRHIGHNVFLLGCDFTDITDDASKCDGLFVIFIQNTHRIRIGHCG